MADAQQAELVPEYIREALNRLHDKEGRWSDAGIVRQHIESLFEQLEAVEMALRYIQWVYDGEDDRCPSCGMTKAQSHDWSCRTAKVLGASIPASEPESR